MSEQQQSKINTVSKDDVSAALIKCNTEMKTNYQSLKPKQIETILSFRDRDVLAVLPTGFGKSLIYQLMPYLEEVKGNSSCTVLVLCPLNAILYEQNARLGNSSFLVDKAALISLKTVLDTHTAENSSDSIKKLCAAKYRYILGTPENILTAEFMHVLQQPNYQATSHITYIAVDECHCVVQWGYNFRPKYRDIYQLRCVLTHSHILAMTATASLAMQRDISNGLHLDNSHIIVAPLDRPNIYLAVIKRLPTALDYDADESFRNTIRPFLCELQDNTSNYRKTIIYCKMQNWCGIGYEEAMIEGIHMYVSQYHADCTEEVKFNIYICLLLYCAQ
jgi:superfamily II DNA helicase RecQ